MSPKAMGAILAIVDRTFSEDEENVLLAPQTTPAAQGHRFRGRGSDGGVDGDDERNQQKSCDVVGLENFKNKTSFDKYLNSWKYYKTMKSNIWKHKVHIQIPDVVLSLVLDEDGASVANRINNDFGEGIGSGEREALRCGDVFLSIHIRQVCYQ